MGNTQASDLSVPSHLLVRQTLATSPHHHQYLIAKIAHLKRHTCPHLLRIIDAHTVSTHHLCSTLSHIYTLIEKPLYTLNTYQQKISAEGRHINRQQIITVLIGCTRALECLRKEGEDVQWIDESLIYLAEDKQGQTIAKIMIPFFADHDLQKPIEKSLTAQLADIIRNLHGQLSQDINKLLNLMSEDRISLPQIQDWLVQPKKKHKISLNLVKNHNKTTRLQRDSTGSFASTGSSLLINGADQSDLMIKQLYQHFDDSISEIEMHSMQTINIAEPQETVHQFPKRYIKSKAFRKVHGGSWSESCEKEGQNITRDQSVKDNVRIESNPYLLDSAKLVQSFIGSSTCR